MSGIHLYVNRGIVFDNTGQHDRAIQDFNEAIRMKPDLAKAHARRGGAYVNIGQHDRAIQDLNEAIRLKPDYFKAYSILGAVYVLTSKKEEGCRSFVRACELGDYEGYEISKQKDYCQ